MAIDIYGIPNCDTVKKARRWLDAQGIGHDFHDYAKEGVDPVRLRGWVADKGRDALLNRRGTTWRKLPDADKQALDDDRAVALMVANRSLIRRPVAEHAGGLLVGFDEAEWHKVLG